MRFGISLPQLDATGFDADGFQAYAARAEELGLESGWVVEQTVGPTPLLAPLEMLAYAAAGTARLRLDLGIAPGCGFRPFPAFGVEREGYLARFTEGLRLMKLIWSDEPRITFRWDPKSPTTASSWSGSPPRSSRG